jgi:hypothetical protein
MDGGLEEVRNCLGINIWWALTTDTTTASSLSARKSIQGTLRLSPPRIEVAVAEMLAVT